MKWIQLSNMNLITLLNIHLFFGLSVSFTFNLVPGSGLAWPGPTVDLNVNSLSTGWLMQSVIIISILTRCPRRSVFTFSLHYFFYSFQPLLISPSPRLSGSRQQSSSVHSIHLNNRKCICFSFRHFPAATHIPAKWLESLRRGEWECRRGQALFKWIMSNIKHLRMSI